VLGTPCVEELALPKSVDGGNLSLNKLVIRWMSVEGADRHGRIEMVVSQLSKNELPKSIAVRQDMKRSE
jgi:hypothetical protein